MGTDRGWRISSAAAHDLPGWIRRTLLKKRGVQMIGGVTYELATYRHCIDYDGDHLSTCDGDPDDLASFDLK